MTTASVDLSNKLAGKYLTFQLFNEEYGIEILKVREIIGVQEITTVPRAPEYVKGVINLRGRIIPVSDLRLKFDLPEREYDKETCIIVVSIDEVLVGIIVDTVSEVVDISTDEIEEAPSFGSDADSDVILGMGKIKDRVVILLSVENILSGDEIKALAGPSA